MTNRPRGLLGKAVAAVNAPSLARLAFVLAIALSLCPAYSQNSSDSSQAKQQYALNRGAQIASAVSTVTGAAISPLFGVCLLGAYEYTKASPSDRAALPFYSKPTFWIVAGVLLILVLLKDVIGGFAPLLKKPLDAVEVLVVNKASLVLIAFPVMVSEITRLTGVQLATLLGTLEPVTYAADFGTSQSIGHIALTGVSLLMGAVVTSIMWTIGHVVDVLCLLSPFPFLDLLMKGFRNLVVLGLMVTVVLSPQTGMVVSVVLILLGAVLFSKALRFSIMGAFFAWDLLRLIVFEHRVTPRQGDGVLGFSTGRVAALPRNTLGRLSCADDGDLEFSYRILGFGPRRRLRLEDARACRVGRGVLYPSVLVPDRGRSGYRVHFRLLPRYKGCEQGICAELAGGQVEDLLVRKGWRKFVTWVEADLASHESAD